MRKSILRIDRVVSSTNGNPAYWITFSDGERYRTGSDTGVAYKIGNPGLREGSDVVIELTRAGRITNMRAA